MNRDAALDVIEHAELLDRATDEVFSTTMGLRCTATEALPDPGGPSISAILGFGGALHGCVILFAPESTALAFAERLMGSPAESVDEIVRDAFGEVCNLLTGSWKAGHAELSSACHVSTPTIVTGTGYSLFGQKGSVALIRHYTCDGFGFTITILMEVRHA